MSELDLLRALSTLDRVHTLARVLVAGQVATAGLLLLVIYLKYRIFATTLAYLKRSDEILQLVKVWNESAHTQTKDARRVLQKVEEKANADVSPSDVLQAVAAVPEQTASKVVERIKSSDSGPHPTVRPPGGV